MLYKRFLISFLFLSPCLVQFTDAQTLGINLRREWNSIDSLLTFAHDPSKALEKVDALYAYAKEESLPSQKIKALLCKISILEKQSELSGTFSPIATDLLTEEIANTPDRAIKSILEAILAHTYERLLKQYEPQMLKRESIAAADPKDLNAWGYAQFDSAITYHYREALKYPDIIQNTDLVNLGEIVAKGQDSLLRPWLYDLIAHLGLEYFKQGNNAGNFAGKEILIYDPRTIEPFNKFIKETFDLPDSSAHLSECLKIFQGLLEFHQKQDDTAALIDVELERINWILDHARFEGKLEAFESALNALSRRYPKADPCLMAWYAQVNIDLGKPNNPSFDINSGNNLYQNQQMIESAVRDSKLGDLGYVKMISLIEKLEEKTLSVETEEINEPNRPFKILVKYRNIDTLYYKIISIGNNDRLWRSLSSGGIDWKYVSAIKTTREFSVPLPQNGDFQQHSTEIMLNQLPTGAYAIISSSGRNFRRDRDKMATNILYTSNITYLGNRGKYYVLNRKTGDIVANANITVLNKIFDSSFSNFTQQVIGATISDKKGYFNINEMLKAKQINNDIETIEFIITTNADYLHIRNLKGRPSNNSEKIHPEDISILAFSRGINILNGVQSQHILVDSLNYIPVLQQDKNNPFDNTVANLKISSVHSPNKPLRKRLWESPDITSIKKEDFLAYFPNDDYANEYDTSKWQEESILYNGKPKTGNEKLTELIGNVKPQCYKIEATTLNKNNKETINTVFTDIFDSKEPVVNQHNICFCQNNIVKPSQKETLLVGSGYPQQTIFQQVSHQTKWGYILTDEINTFKRKGGWQTFQYTPSPDDLGITQIKEIFIKDNRAYMNIFNVDVESEKEKMEKSILKKGSIMPFDKHYLQSCYSLQTSDIPKNIDFFNASIKFRTGLSFSNKGLIKKKPTDDYSAKYYNRLITQYQWR